MARRLGHTGHTPSSALPIPAVIDHDLSHLRHQKQPRIDQPSNGSIAGAAKTVIQANSAAGSSYRNPSSNQEANEGVSDADAAEADEDDDDDGVGDGDALAPSGCALEKYGNQAGHIVTEGEQQTACKRSQGKGTGNSRSRPRISERTKTSERNVTNRSEDCDSDDEAYNGVDDISDSDEDEPDVEKLEEQNIIELEEGVRSSRAPATAPRAMSETSDIWEGFDLEGALFISDIPYFDEQYGRTDQAILESDIELFQATSVFDDFEPTPSLPRSTPPPTRRVHFREPVYPPSDSSEMVSNDEDLNCLFNLNTRSDMEAAPLPSLCEHGNGEDGDDSSGGNSSGYETDYGDTTDEEDVPKSATTRPQSLLRQPSLSSLETVTINAQIAPSAGPLASPFKVPTTPARHRPGPRLGSFKANPHKPFAMIDCTGDNIIITPAKRPTRASGSFSQVASTRTSTADASPIMSQATLANTLDDNEVDYSDFSSQVTVDPMLAQGSGSMTDIFTPTATTTQGQRISGASNSVFFPMDGMGAINALYAVDDQDDEDNDDEDLLNVRDFINFSDDSSDNDDKAPDRALPTPISTSPTGRSDHIQPKTPSPNGSSTNDLMAHFDKGVIGAFRQGQNQHQQSHRPHSGLSLNRHVHKSGRHAPANSPVNPPKKRKMSGTFSTTGPFGPFAKRRLMPH